MALQTPFFGKRDSESLTSRVNQPGTGLTSPLSTQGKSTAVTPSASSVAPAPAASAAPKNGGSKLTVGPNIKLKGVEITDCDTLIVEGLVEAAMDARVMEIAEQGAFKGSAQVDTAEIRGEFDGNLTVREKLTILATGKVTGQIRYGKISIEEGGQLSGEIQTAGTQKHPERLAA